MGEEDTISEATSPTIRGGTVDSVPVPPIGDIMRSYLSNHSATQPVARWTTYTLIKFKITKADMSGSSLWDRLRRFLVLGSEGGTYYATERQLTQENVRCLDECIKENAGKTARMIHAMRDRVPKRDVIFFSWAYTLRMATRARALSRVVSMTLFGQVGTYYSSWRSLTTCVVGVEA